MNPGCPATHSARDVTSRDGLTNMKIGNAGRRSKGSILIGALSGLIIVLLVLGIADSVGYLKSGTKTLTETSTITSTATQQVADIIAVGDDFTGHLFSFGTGNVSAIISQYEAGANVTWYHLQCLAGIYTTSGSNSSFAQDLDYFYGYGHSGGLGFAPAPHGLFVGNVTKVDITAVSDGSLVVNSTFGLMAPTFNGDFTATISVEDTYFYNLQMGAWLISQETWNFINYSVPFDVLTCGLE